MWGHARCEVLAGAAVTALRLVTEAMPQHESQWAAIESVAGKIGASVAPLSGLQN
jgi:hypothetical protein